MIKLNHNMHAHTIDWRKVFCGTNNPVMFTLYRKAFSGDMKTYLMYIMDNNGTELELVVHTHRTSCRSGWTTGFGELKPQSLLLNIYFRLSGFQSLLPLIHFSNGSIPAQTVPKSGSEPIRYVTLQFRVRRGFAPLQKSRRNHRLCV